MRCLLCGLKVCLFVLLALPLAAQTPPRITLLEPTGKLTWTNVQLDRLYRLQAAPAPSQSWTNLGNSLQGTGATMVVTVPLTNGAGIFRVADVGTCCTNNGGTNFATAVSLGSACGDTTPTTFNRTGCGTAWYRVSINECQFGSFSWRDLKANFTLTQPTGSDYDLYVYRSDGGLRQASTAGGSTAEVIAITETDLNLFPDTSNSLELWIEVRRFSGVGCNNWSLSVQVGW